MKKIFYALFLAIVFCLGINNVSATSLKGTIIVVNGNYAYKHYTKNGVNTAGGTSWFLTADGKVAYCIDFGKSFNDVYVSGSKGELRSFVGSDEVYNKLNLIAYYGYGYNANHNTQKYYLATQYLVWKTLYEFGSWPEYNLSILEFYTSGAYYHAGSKIDLSAEVNEINSLISKHYAKPSFCGNTYTVVEGESLTIADTGSVLGNYTITNNNTSNVSYQVSGNNIVVKGLKASTGNTISFNKAGLSGSSYVYGASGYQNLFVVGNTPSVSCKINVNVKAAVKYGTLKVIKVEKDNTEVRIPGVVFEIYDSNNKLVDTITTDKNGEASIKLVVGSYKVKETITGEEYVLNDNPVSVTLTENQIKTMTFENEKKIQYGNLKIVKVDKDTNAKLSGVVFEIYNYNTNKLVDTITTDKNGEASIKLVTGAYKIKEIKTKSGYVLNTNLITVVITKNETKTVTIENSKEEITKYGTLKVIKVEKDNTEVRIPGVVFEIYDSNNNFVDTVITDKNGEASVKLAIGTYKVKEVLTGIEYVLDGDPVTVELKENDIKTITFENEKVEEEVIEVPTVEEIVDAPKTGDIAIYGAWMVGILAFAYSVYRFRKIRL